ncbi:MAG: hypothetical protein BYD32DRAFT_437743 [Podila humilis]|nr:MAG: hypothetical protein BYD32DRAFT_437743 [Podila humilis]
MSKLPRRVQYENASAIFNRSTSAKLHFSTPFEKRDIPWTLFFCLGEHGLHWQKTPRRGGSQWCSLVWVQHHLQTLCVNIPHHRPYSRRGQQTEQQDRRLMSYKSMQTPATCFDPLTHTFSRSTNLTTMKFTTLATLFVAVPCLFTVVQAEPCGGGPLSRVESDALRTYRGALFQLYFATPINNSMSACFCYLSDKNGCKGSMCAACNNSDYSEEDFIKNCRQAVHAITPDVGPGSNAWCDYPGLKGLKMVNYWKQNN